MAHAPVSCTEKGRYEVEEDVIIDRIRKKKEMASFVVDEEI